MKSQQTNNLIITVDRERGCSSKIQLTNCKIEYDPDSLQLVFGVPAKNSFAGYYIEFELSPEGIVKLLHAYEVNHLVNNYLHVDSEKAPPKELTVKQVDVIIEWLEFMRNELKGKMYPDKQVELFPGWSVKISAGATLQLLVKNNQIKDYASTSQIRV